MQNWISQRAIDFTRVLCCRFQSNSHDEYICPRAKDAHELFVSISLSEISTSSNSISINSYIQIFFSKQTWYEFRILYFDRCVGHAKLSNWNSHAKHRVKSIAFWEIESRIFAGICHDQRYSTSASCDTPRFVSRIGDWGNVKTL